MNNYEILIKTVPYILEKYCNDSSPLVIQNIIRNDVFRIISETCLKLVNLLNLSEDIEYLLYVVKLIKELEMVNPDFHQQFVSTVFYRLADQVKDLISKNEGKGHSRIAVQKEKISVFGYFDFFVLEKQNEHVNWIYFTQFSQFFGKLVVIVEEERLDTDIEREATATLRTILEIFLKDLDEFLKSDSHLKLENHEEFCAALSETLQKVGLLKRLGLTTQFDDLRTLLQKMTFSFAKHFIERAKNEFFELILEKNNLFLLSNLFETVFEFKQKILENFKIEEEQNLLNFLFHLVKRLVQHVNEALADQVSSIHMFVH